MAHSPCVYTFESDEARILFLKSATINLMIKMGRAVERELKQDAIENSLFVAWEYAFKADGARAREVFDEVVHTHTQTGGTALATTAAKN